MKSLFKKKVMERIPEPELMEEKRRSFLMTKLISQKGKLI